MSPGSIIVLPRPTNLSSVTRNRMRVNVDSLTRDGKGKGGLVFRSLLKGDLFQASQASHSAQIVWPQDEAVAQEV